MTTLIDLLRSHAQRRPDDMAYAFIRNGVELVDRLSYQQLEVRARSIAAFLSKRTHPQDRVLLLFEPGLDFTTAFFGCLYAGVVAVPAPAPRGKRLLPRVQAIADDVKPRLALSSSKLLPHIANLQEQSASPFSYYGVDQIPHETADAWEGDLPEPDALALLQYTSGSTSAPKGAMISHHNLFEALADIGVGYPNTPADLMVTWLPTFHDLGLAYAKLGPFFHGYPCYLMSPEEFVRKPVLWLQAMSHFRATHSAAPNFAYELCLHQITDDEIAALDLNPWRVTVSAAEPIKRQTVERFSERFAPCGFRSTTFAPCYGMAEATCKISSTPQDVEPTFLTVQGTALERGRVAEAVPGDPHVHWIAGCGYPGPNTQIVIVASDTGQPCAPDEVGEIWVRGPSVSQGYWQRPDATQEAYCAQLINGEGDGFLRTGDLGFMRHGQLFVTGRLKDLIIVGGNNHYPQDIEATVQQCSDFLRLDRGAVFSIDLETGERVVVVQELVRHRAELDVDRLFGDVRQVVADMHGLAVASIAFIRFGTLPLTSSGKVQRRATRDAFLSGQLKTVATWHSPRQIAREVAAPQPGSEPSRRSITHWLMEQMAKHLEVPPETIEPGEPLARHGVSSIMAIQFAADIESRFGCRFDPTLFYDYPTLNDVAHYLIAAEEQVRVGRDHPATPQEADEPIAIVGLACRFPGASNADAFWQLLHGGRDAIREVPVDRELFQAFYASADGADLSRLGGFLDHVDQFDPAFFRMSPREADLLDPQHRLFLEVTWEAFEHAGCVPEQWAGRAVGVFVGLSSHDYMHGLHQQPGPLPPHATTGNAHCMAANRLSYLFDWHGPSLSIDTACSSSLVAVHQACESLRRGECEIGVAGGVNLILDPQLTAAFHSAGMLATDGHCKTFDQRADGYVRGEGCGVVILKPLSAAQRSGDRVLAILGGSAINQDGQSNGLTAPNGKAQEAVVDAALRAAGVSPALISYVEAHGTGTRLGDPVEVKALHTVLRRSDSEGPPCMIGAVKTNVGHLEAAAGIAGLIKTVLAMQHLEIPPNLNFEQLNSYLADAEPIFHFPVAPTPWEPIEGRRLAGVSSFGFGGTNAHVILEAAAPETLRPTPEARLVHLLCLSAHTETALVERTRDWSHYMRSRPQITAAALAYNTHTMRTHFRHRHTVVGASAAELAEQLDTFLANPPAISQAARGSVDSVPRVAFVFAGQGAQAAGAGRQLFETFPVFRSALEECDRLLRPDLGCSVIEHLFPVPPTVSALDETWLTQPALFAFEYALAQLWSSWGIAPEAVMGHSLGEYVAAVVAGVFSLADGLRLVVHRGQLMHTITESGAMAAVWAQPDQVEPLLQGQRKQLSIAAYNSPEQLVLSGAAAALDKVLKQLVERGIAHRRLPVSQAFHSPLMQPMLDRFSSVLQSIRFQAPTIPLVSNVTAQWVEAVTDPAYWREHVLAPVRFGESVDFLCRQGINVFIDIGPRSVLAAMMSSREDWPTDVPVSPSLPATPSHEGADELRVILTTLGDLYRRGINVAWEAFHAGDVHPRLDLPSYPFQRQRCWYTQEAVTAPSTAGAVSAPAHLVPADAPQVDSPSRNGLGRPTYEMVLAQLTAMVAPLLRVAPETIDIHAPFLEMGADSLVLVNALRLIESTFGMKIPIKQLFDSTPHFDALARHLVDRLPMTPEPVRPVNALQLSTQPRVEMREATHLPDDLRELLARQQETVDVLLAQQQQLYTHLLQSEFNTGNRTLMPAGVAEASPSAPPSLPPWRPSTDTSERLKHRQQQALDALIARYTARTQTSKARTEEARPRLADNRASAGFRFSTKEMVYPLIGDRAQGTRVWDLDGNAYLDITMGFGVYLFGHAPPFVVAALQEEIERGFALGPQTRHVGEVTELLHTLTGMDRACFCNSGTEAVMTALRLARAVTGRSKVVVFEGAYHGHFDGVLAATKQTDQWLEPVPMAPGVTRHLVGDIVPLPYNSELALEIIRAEGPQLAAVLVEPVQSRRPDLQPQAFLQQLRDLTQATGTVLIFDEMITGFRIHPGGAQAYFGVQADLATYGKIAGGGLPIGVVAGKSWLMDALDGGMWHYGDDSYPAVDTTFFAGTFNKHPLAMAAARAVLTHIREDGGHLHASLNARTAQLAETLNALFQRHQVPIQMAHFGSLFRFMHPSNQDVFIYHLLDKGIFIWEGRNCFLSTAHTDEDVTRIVEAVAETIRDMQEGGFFPSQPESQALPVSHETPAVPLRFALSTAQQQLCLLARLSPAASAAYHESVILRYEGALDDDALQRALRALVRQHEALRTLIDVEHDVQSVSQLAEPQLTIRTLADSESLEAGLASTISQPFPLGQQPLFRVAVLRPSPSVHYLVLCAHHLIADGWSLRLLVQDLGVLYRAACQGQHVESPRAATFRDFLSRQQTPEREKEREMHIQFWLEQLAGPLPQLDVYTDHPRPAVQSFHGAAVDLVLEETLVWDLKILARHQRMTLYMILLAGYGLLLHRLSGQDDIIIGIPVSGRSEALDTEVVGFCSHMLPIRSRYQRTQSIAEYLEAFRSLLLEAYEHQDLPFAQLLQRYNPRFDPSHSPIFSATFNLDQSEGLDDLFPADVTFVAPPVLYTKFDLGMNLTQIGDHYQLRLEYARDLYEAATAHRFLSQYVAVLSGLAEKSDQRLGAISLMTPEERAQWLVDRNATATSRPPYDNVVAWFDAQVRTSGSHTAVTFEGQALSYAQLDAQANGLAQYLRGRGVGPDTAVGVCVDPGLDLPIALLGVLKAGGFYVPMDPAYPRARLAYMARDVDSRLIVTYQRYRELWSGLEADLICLDEIRSDLRTADRTAPALPCHPSQLAYTIHTSGSTGQPKGVSVPHNALVNLLWAMTREPGFRAGETLLSVTTLSFDIAGLELFLPLVQGGTLALVSSEARRDHQRLSQLLVESGATTMQATPATWKLLFEAGWPGVPGLTILCGGEALPPDLARQLVQSGGVVWNMYGPTETTIWSCLRQLLTADQPVDLGLPIANTRVYVVDADLQPAPIGVGGELVIGGAGLARGYWGKPAQTAERFIPDPFASQPGSRLYRTGDFVRCLDDGRLEFLGRMDDQVKINGFRIELDEISAVLKRHDAIDEAVVTAVPDSTGAPVLSAYLVPAAQAIPTVAALRATVQAELPPYMVPVRFHFLSRLPLTPNRKIDRQALASSHSAEAPLDVEYVAPATSVETELSQIWGEVLERERIGIHDNFFDLGGNSLALARVHAKTQLVLRREFPLVDCVSFPTIHSLARHLTAEFPSQDGLDEADRRAQRRRGMLRHMQTNA